MDALLAGVGEIGFVIQSARLPFGINSTFMLSHSGSTERDPLWRREMRERWRRPITLFFVTLYVTGLSVLAYSLYSSVVPVGAVELGAHSNGIGHRLFTSLLGAQIEAWIVFALLLAAPTVAAERERRALPDYLLAGVTPRQIVRAKFASVATFTLVMCAVPFPILALCFPLGGVEPLELLAGAFFEVGVALSCAAFGLLISVHSARVTAAMQQGIALGAAFLIVTFLVLPDSLEASFWWRLVFAVPLVAVIGGVIKHCENSLDLLAHDLEANERALQPPAPVIEAPHPQLQPHSQPPSIQPDKPKAPRAEPAPQPTWRSCFDWCIEKVASRNAVTQREVRVGLRASRARWGMSAQESIERNLIRLWSAIGFCCTALVALLGFDVWWHLSLVGAALALLVVTGITCSSAFTSEREHQTLAQLQMCSLSSFEVVVGKMAATLLLIARGWSGPLLALLVVGWGQGADVVFGCALLLFLSAVLAALIAIVFSLVCRHTPVATGGTFAALLFAFVFVPFAPQGLALFFPALRGVFSSFLLTHMWAQPLSVVIGFPAGLSLAGALFRLVLSLCVLDALLLLGATLLLASARRDESDRGPRFWERDLSRSWG